MKRTKISHKLAAGIFAGLAFAPSTSWAVGASNADFSDATKAIETSASRIPNLITTTAFVAGIAMAIAGIFKLKAHVDNPAQAPLKDALIRLAIGGALLAFPLLTNMMVGLIGQETSDAHLVHTKINNLTY